MIPLPDPHVATAVVVAGLILAYVYFRREDLEAGEMVYGGIVATIIAASFLVVPYRIPQTNRIVWGWSWRAPEYVDPQLAETFSAEFIERIRGESPAPVSGELARNVVTRSASSLGSYRRLYWAAIDLSCFLGFFFVPERLNRLIYRWFAPRRTEK